MKLRIEINLGATKGAYRELIIARDLLDELLPVFKTRAREEE